MFYLGADAPAAAPSLAHGFAVPAPRGGRRAELAPGGGGGTLVLDAQGASVPSPGGGSRAVLAPGGGGGALVLDAHGARVGWFGPAGTFGPDAFAHGAAVIGMPPAIGGARRGGWEVLDIGAHMFGSAKGSRNAADGPVCRAVGAEFDGVTAFGWEEVCTLAWILGALGSGVQLKREPKGKCWTTGNLDKTSALYILIMPWVCKLWFENGLSSRPGPARLARHVPC